VYDASKPEQIAAWVRGQMTQLANKCGTRWLVVFDDVWNTPVCYQAVELLQTALPAGVKTLITTRQTDAASYLRAKSVELYELNEADALTLLHNLRDNERLTDDHLKRAVNIIKGHPLTLELAIASLNDAEDANDIDAILDEYEGGVRDGSPFDAMNLGVETPRALNVVFGRSYNRLPADDRARFRVLGVLAPDAVWNRPLSADLWTIEDERALTAAHKTLRLAAFIGQDAKAETAYGGVYYRQHPLLRAYARALLSEADETEAAIARYADHVIDQANQFRTLNLEEWGQLDPLLPHVEVVGDELATALPDTPDPAAPLTRRVCDFASRVYHYVYLRPQAVTTPDGPSLRGLNWLLAGLSAARALDETKHVSLFLHQIGLAYKGLGEGRTSIAYYEQSIQLNRQLGDQRVEAATLNNIGVVWDALGEKQKVLDYYEQALPLRRAVGDRGGEAATLNNIGAVWNALGEKQKALDYYEQALPLRRAVSDRGGEAVTLSNIGAVWDDLGEKRKTLNYYEQALPLHRAVGDRIGEAVTLSNIGRVWDALGEKQKALDFFDQVLPLFGDVGDRGGEATVLNNMGRVWDDLGKKRKALDTYEQALLLFRAVSDRRGEAATLNNMGMVWGTLREKQKALDFFEQALPLIRAVSDRRGEAATLNNIGFIYLQNGDLERTVAIQEQIIGIMQDIGAVTEEAGCHSNIAVVLERMGRVDEAITHVEQAIALLKAKNLPRDAGGQTVADLERQLAGLRGETPPQDDQQAQVMAMLVQIYAEGGADAVRQMLAGQVPGDIIEALIAQFQTANDNSQDN
jgi:tetratricopeptide (TPR) repeat protein